MTEGALRKLTCLHISNNFNHVDIFSVLSAGSASILFGNYFVCTVSSESFYDVFVIFFNITFHSYHPRWHLSSLFTIFITLQPSSYHVGDTFSIPQSLSYHLCIICRDLQSFSHHLVLSSCLYHVRHMYDLMLSSSLLLVCLSYF